MFLVRGSLDVFEGSRLMEKYWTLRGTYLRGILRGGVPIWSRKYVYRTHQLVGVEAACLCLMDMCVTAPSGQREGPVSEVSEYRVEGGARERGEWVQHR